MIHTCYGIYHKKIDGNFWEGKMFLDTNFRDTTSSKHFAKTLKIKRSLAPTQALEEKYEKICEGEKYIVALLKFFISLLASIMQN